MSETSELAPAEGTLPEGFFPPDDETAAETREAASPAAEAELAEPESTETDPEAPKREPWFMRRIAQLTAKETAAVQRAAELEAKIEALEKGLKPSSDPEVQRQIDARAAQIAEERIFIAECNRVAAEGQKAFPDFTQALSTLWSATGGPSPSGTLLPAQVALVSAAIEAGDAHRVLYELAKNPDEADRIASLSPARMGAAIAKLAAKPALPTKAAAKLPPPIKPVGTASSDPNPNGSMKEFDAWFESQRRR